MKLYIGIKQNNQHLYIITINSKGEILLKSKVPSSCPKHVLIDFITIIRDAFSVPIKIATCLDDYLNQSLLQDIKKKFPSVTNFNSSVYYNTDILPEEAPYEPVDYYRYALLLTLLDSLQQ